MRARLPAKLGAAVCLLLCAWFLAPLGMGIVHIGMLWPSALLVLAAARLLRPDVFRRLLRKKWLRWMVRAALGLGLAAALGIFGWMVSAAANRAAPAESTVIVLGCQVRGTEPSLTLQRRVDAAADYLRAHPQARCVASGGQSDDEEISEAECIRAALIADPAGDSDVEAHIEQPPERFLIPRVAVDNGARADGFVTGKAGDEVFRRIPLVKEERLFQFLCEQDQLLEVVDLILLPAVHAVIVEPRLSHRQDAGIRDQYFLDARHVLLLRFVGAVRMDPRRPVDVMGLRKIIHELILLRLRACQDTLDPCGVRVLDDLRPSRFEKVKQP